MSGPDHALTAGIDDTIEIVLSAKQLLSLEHASEEAEASAAETPPAAVQVPAMVISHPIVPVVAPIVNLDRHAVRRDRPWHQSPLARMAANTLAFVGFAWWSVSQLAGTPHAPHPVVQLAAAKPVVAGHPAAVAAPAPSAAAVHVVNPFDRSEVFEFPAGTSDEEGRQKVAQILLARARERLNRWEHSPLRTANNTPVRKAVLPGS